MSIPSRSFPIPTMTGLHKTGGIKGFSSNEDEETEGLFESSPSEGLEMEIFKNYSSAEPSEEDSKAMTRNEFSTPTLISGEKSPVDKVKD